MDERAASSLPDSGAPIDNGPDTGEVAESKPPKGVRQNPANSGRQAGYAQYIIARIPQKGYQFLICVWCNQPIYPGYRYVRATKYLYFRRKWFDKGPRHDSCWEIESRS